VKYVFVKEFNVGERSKAIGLDRAAIVSKIGDKPTVQQMKEFCISLGIKLLDNHRKIDSFLEYEKKHKRIPILCFAGHVDHGKTSILDRIRTTKTVEKGGITQNITVTNVKTNNANFILIDTPGHGTFSEPRSLVKDLSDILVLVVSVDGVQEQTIEILKKNTKCVILCINKIDKGLKPEAEQKLYRILAENGVFSENFGGEVLTTKISAKTGEGMDELLEKLSIQAEELNLLTDLDREAIGIVVSVALLQGKGYVVNVVFLAGTVRLGDVFFCGESEGKVKTIEKGGVELKEAQFFASITGFEDCPKLGDRFFVVPKELLEVLREERNRDVVKKKKKVFDPTNPNFIAKSDDQVKLMALVKVLEQRGNVLSASIGQVVETELQLAKNLQVKFVLFKKIDKKLDKKFPVVQSEIIYEIIDELDKKEEEKPIEYEEQGVAEIRKIFQIKKNRIAGCRVISGNIVRGPCKVIRGDKEVQFGKISSMKRLDQVIEESKSGTECGLIIQAERFVSDFEIGDRIIALSIKNQ
jgi:translation initiation factor IF-2